MWNYPVLLFFFIIIIIQLYCNSRSQQWHIKSVSGHWEDVQHKGKFSGLITRDSRGNKSLVPFNFNFRAWYILWSPVRCGACAQKWEAEWMLIALYPLPCALYPPATRQTRIGDISGRLGRMGRQISCWWRYCFSSVSLEFCASVFDIVTVEGEGCLVACRMGGGERGAQSG